MAMRNDRHRTRAALDRRRWLSLLVTAILLPAGLIQAECPEESWATGASIAFEDEIVLGSTTGGNGIGGSGVVPDPGDDDGIGGSGLSPTDDSGEDGIGGSGLYGTVTGFGSVCVNGRSVLYDDTVDVSVDEGAAVIADLAVGQVVRVDFEAREDGLYARRIDVQHEVLGPVTASDKDSVEVMGQRVALEHLSDGTQIEIEIGMRIAVSGLRRSDGTVVASRIDPAGVAVADLVRGVLVPVGDFSFRIGTTPIGSIRPDDMEMSPPRAGLGSGDVVREIVLGSWNSERSMLLANRRGMSPVASSQVRRVDLEGYVERNEAGVLAVSGVAFSIREGAASFRRGDRVRVRGSRREAGEPLRLRRAMRVPERPMLRSLNRSMRPSKLLRPGLQRPPRGRGDSSQVRRGRPERPQNHHVRRPPPRHDLLPPRRPPPR